MHEWGQLLCDLSGFICIFAVKIARVFFLFNLLVMLWWLVSMIFFIVICRSISYMVVPFNRYSLGYFLKQFIEHYPKLNCIYYPLTQLLKWSTSIWFCLSVLLFVFPSNFTITCKRDRLKFWSPFVPKPLSYTTHKGSSSDLEKKKKKKPALVSKYGLLQQFNYTKIYGAPTLWSYLPLFSFCSKFVRQRSLISEQGVWALDLARWFSSNSFNLSGFLSTLASQRTANVQQVSWLWSFVCCNFQFMNKCCFSRCSPIMRLPVLSILCLIMFAQCAWFWFIS